MTIQKIVVLLNEEGTKHIHKIYSIDNEWCYITSKSGARIRLSPDMSNELIYESINQVLLNNKQKQ